MNLPNSLTIFRLLLIPVFILVFFSGIHNSLIISLIIFFIAGCSDVLDGYIARKYNLITKIGTVLDPLADKLMLITVLTCLLIKGFIPSFVVIVITIKEVFMILSGILLYKKGTVIPSNRFGKVSTVLFYISLFIFIFNRTVGTYLLYISVLSALIALINYFVVYHKNKENNLSL